MEAEKVRDLHALSGSGSARAMLWTAELICQDYRIIFSAHATSAMVMALA